MGRERACCHDISEAGSLLPLWYSKAEEQTVEMGMGKAR